MSGEPEVHPRAVGEVGDLGLQIRYLAHRTGVRVLDDRRDACTGRGRGAAREVLARLVARVHEVHVRVDHARHDEQAARVHALARLEALRRDRGDPAAAHVQVRRHPPRARHERSALDSQIEHLCHLTYRLASVPIDSIVHSTSWPGWTYAPLRTPSSRL
ncbi:hypothetical protein GCM10025869_16330 [Homoserinibacter gongjuensis]|uniref:Uncharacterized protein n=1 Tax=Homoserinibacter gongjuensis TaxID=1162968 RepID=A0ABQ6JV03_9MICO|nr:hypothetical protein GCM10025869_16330 [Homoserinibacter gongjuensis]